MVCRLRRTIRFENILKATTRKGETAETDQTHKAWHQNRVDRARGTRAAANEDQRPSEFSRICELFQRLPREQMPVLAGACEPVEFKMGDTVITEGQQGNEFFIISPVKR